MKGCDDLLVSYIRAAILYLLLITAIRLMGKRQLGQMEPSEFVVALLIADLAAVPMQDPAIPLLSGVIPILVVVSLELLFSVFSYKSVRFRRILCGKPVILIENGKILQDNLKKTRLTMDELTGHLREREISDLDTVKFAILETNGQISALLYGKDRPPSAADYGMEVPDPILPITLITEGNLIHANLSVANKNRQWLEQQLKQHNCTVNDVYMMTLKTDGQVRVIRKEQKK